MKTEWWEANLRHFRFRVLAYRKKLAMSTLTSVFQVFCIADAYVAFGFFHVIPLQPLSQACS